MKNEFKIFFVVLLLVLVLSKVSFAEPEYVPGEIVIKFKSNVINIPDGKISALNKDVVINAVSIQGLNSKFGVTKINDVSIKTFVEPGEKFIRGKWVTVPDLSNLFVLVLPEDVDVIKAVKEYSNDPNVEYASPNYIRKASLSPNDSYYRDYNPGLPSQWNQNSLFKIQAEKAWDITTGTANVTVAVIDTGLNYKHVDISGRTVEGYDFVNNDDDPWDDHGHGSHVAGIIAANTNNNQGIAGVNWNCKVMPLKILDSGGYGDAIKSYHAIVWAAEHGADVINMSYGGLSWTTWESGAVDYAYNTYGCILVGAAGNSGVEQKEYPAAYDDVICVASTDRDDNRSVWTISQSSNYGSWVDVSAPGGGWAGSQGNLIVSLWQPNTSIYAVTGGTSQASPHVAGLATLILSKFPGLTNDQVVQRIKNTTDNIDSENPSYIGKLGTGRINAYNALYPLEASITYPPDNSLVSSGIVSIIGTATGEGFATYEVTYRDASSSTWEVITTSNSPVDNDVLATWNAEGLWGKKYLKLKVIHTDTTSIETRNFIEIGVPDGVNLRTDVLNYPNPFNPYNGPTYIRFKTTKMTDANIFIFDLRGNLIWRRFNGENENYYPENGEYRVPWDGKSVFGSFVANGVYVYQIVVDNKIIGRNTMIVMK